MFTWLVILWCGSVGRQSHHATLTKAKRVLKKKKTRPLNDAWKSFFENLGLVIPKASWDTPKVEFTTSDMNQQLQGAISLSLCLSIYLSTYLYLCSPLFLVKWGGGGLSLQPNFQDKRGGVDRTSRGIDGKERGWITNDKKVYMQKHFSQS